ncbi:MAG: tetratricopeptide repeat protein [Elusimicrobiota bacterium]
MRLAACVVLFLGAGARADDRHALLQAGLDALYNLDYAESRRQFQAVIARHPEDAVGHYAMATAIWWELTNEFDEKNDALEKDFVAAVDGAVETAKKAIEAGDPQGEAHLSLGGALGLRSRWDAIQSRWVRAYFNGKGAYNAQKKALDLNPELYDAYLGVGIFHYYTATLPSVIKVLAKLVRLRGDKERGLREIRLAMEKGFFSRTAAKLFLVGIYGNREKKPLEALALVRESRREYPRSSFFHFLEMLTLENAAQWETLRREALDYIARVEGGDPSYRAHYLHRGRYAEGNSYLGEGRAEEALKIYEDVLRRFSHDDRWISFTYLNRGKALDLLGRREEALESYREVLKRRDVWELHDKTKDLMAKPFAREAAEG